MISKGKVTTNSDYIQQSCCFLHQVNATTAAFLRQSFFTPENLSHGHHRKSFPLWGEAFPGESVFMSVLLLCNLCLQGLHHAYEHRMFISFENKR